MSALPDNELDLEKLFLPAWAQQPASAKHYSTYEGEQARPERRGDRPGRHPGRRPGPAGGPPGERTGGRGPRSDQRGPRREGDRRKPDRERFGRREEPRERPEPPPPLPEIDLAFLPDERGVESLARQIRMTGRAYPLFDIARLVLQKPERHAITFSVKKNAEGQIIQPLFACALDDTVWLSEDEAIAHVLKNHFTTFYQAERTATEPPKGKYTFVAQCGMSGVILGPPNYHDYQNQLRKLHAERFSRMPFDVFKARVKIVRDEEVVKKWIDDQSWKTEYICLNMPEPLRLNNREAVEQHFRETHKENIIKSVEAQTLSGTTARNLRSSGLVRLVRQAWEDQRRFPLQIATVLSQRFASHGLQFFKVNKAVTHVSVARPHFLDLETTPVSEGVTRIIAFVNEHPKCTRRQLMEALTPTPAPPPTPAPAPTASAETQAAPGAEAVPAAETTPEPTPEQTAMIADLHWLIHQGHIIEFANGVIETAKKPAFKPPKPEPKAPQAPEQPAESTAPPEAAADTGAPTAPAESASLQPSAQPAAPDPGSESPFANETASEVEQIPEPEPASETKAPEPAPGSESTEPK